LLSVKPVNVQLVAVAGTGVQVPPPLDAVTRYPVSGDPPPGSGANQDTTADSWPATAWTQRGAFRTVLGVAADEAADTLEYPAEVMVLTVKV